jgi:RND family efflux transporter MFP subunit
MKINSHPLLRRAWLAALLAGSSLPLAAATLSGDGITEPILDATLSSPVAGIVASHHFKEGDFVKLGQAIVELDKRQEELEAKRRSIVLAPMKADWEGARFLFQQPKSSISKEALDKKQSDYDVAVVEHELAEDAVRKRSITAPFDGSIVEIFLKPGEACQIQQPVVRIVDTRRCYFVANLEAKIAAALRAGQKVDLELSAATAPMHFPATISFISPVVDPASGLLKIKAVFENPDGKIRPGIAGRMIFEDTKNAGQ